MHPTAADRFDRALEALAADPQAPQLLPVRVARACADARGPAQLVIDKSPGIWRVRQIVDDPAGDHDWGLDAEVDLEASDEEGTPVIRLVSAGRRDDAWT